MPLFLELVREAGTDDPALMRDALAGLRAYTDAPRVEERQAAPTAGTIGGSKLRDLGGTGPPAVLVPSLINPPSILDLDPQTSLAAAVRQMGRHAFLLDWGPASERGAYDVAGHVEQILVPLLAQIGEPAALVGYCLGGAMAIAAANRVPVEQVVTLAAPWNFDRYPAEGRSALEHLWARSRGSARSFGALPMELLQAAFWSLDPNRTVRKFAEFSRLDPASAEARRFITLEDWANEGEALPFPAAEELMDGLFAKNVSGRGAWVVGGAAVADALTVPLTNLTASHDRIAPASTAPSGDVIAIPSGHVGMIVGSARKHLHRELASLLDPSCR